MDVLKSLTRVVVVITSMLCVVPVHGQERAPSATPTTLATLDELCASLNRLVQHGQQTGDYMLAKAAVKSRHAIEVWRTANREVLDTPFGELDATVRETFDRTRTLIDDAIDERKSRADVAQQLTEVASLIVDMRPGADRQASILGFMPRVVPPDATGAFTLRIRGINLDKANLVLHLPGGRAERVITGPYEVQFTVPLSAVPSDPTRLQVHPLTITYTTPAKGFWAWLFERRDPASRELSVVTLPTSVATFELTGTRMSDRRKEMPFTAEPVQFRGTREQVYKTVSPPPAARDGSIVWRWDLSKDLRLVQSRGVQGRCEGIDLNRSSETGISVYAHVDADGKSRKRRRPNPAWVDCTVVGTIYRVEQTTQPLEKQTVTLTWTGEQRVELPADVHEADLIARTFDGRLIRFSDSDDDKLFEIRREPERFVIVPKIPDDVLAGD